MGIDKNKVFVQSTPRGPRDELYNKYISFNPIPDKRQPDFGFGFSGVVPGGGHCRNLMGNRIEDYVIKTLRLIDIPINGKYEVNFDAGLYCADVPVFFEVKSLKRGSKSCVYKFRLEKEVAVNQLVLYVFCVHNIKNPQTQADITAGLDDAVFYIMALEDVQRLVVGLPLRKIESENQSGYNRAGYCEGYYNISFNSIEKCACFPGKINKKRVKMSKNATEIVKNPAKMATEKGIKKRATPK